MPPTASTTPLPEPSATGKDGAYRSLPVNIEAEKALLGAIFVDNRAYEKVSEFLRPAHFAIPEHGRIFEACGKLIDKGQIANPVTLKGFFDSDEGLAGIGGAAYLVDLAASAVLIINAAEYGRIVYDLHLKRELIGLGEGVVNRAFAGDVDESATDQIEQAEQMLYDLASTGEHEVGFRPFTDSVKSAIDMAKAAHRREGGLAGVATGFSGLDKLLGGLHRSDLVVLAGRPAMGKTALATNIAYNAAYDRQKSESGEDGAVVGFFSLEMSAEQLASRILSEQTEISSDRMRKGELSNDEFTKLVMASQTLHQIPVYIDDTPALTVSALRTRARRLKRVHGLGLIVVDYLQLIGAGRHHDSRVQEVSEITRGLKTLAKELDVPVLALSQLSRAVEQRENKRPLLSDMRESGSIEQDADVVMFIFREEYYLERDKPVQRGDEADDRFMDRLDKWERRMDAARGTAEINVSKQRHGPTGDIDLMFDGMYTRFGNLDRQHGE